VLSLEDNQPAMVQSLQAALGPLLAVRKHRRVRGGTRNEPLCAACTRPDPGFWRTCPGCGQTGRINTGRRACCTIQLRLHELLGNRAGDISPGLQPLYQALAATARPATVEAWLNRSAAPSILGELAAKKLTHRALDELAEARRSSTCAASCSPSGRCRRAMSRWPGWNAGPPS
jgi:hypothetical protein